MLILTLCISVIAFILSIITLSLIIKDRKN